MTPLFGQFELLHPARLAALVLLPVIVWLAWRTTTMMLPWQRHASTVCRALIFVLLVLALVRPANHWESAEQSVIFVRDVSASALEDASWAQDFIEQAAAGRAGHEVKQLLFAGKPAAWPTKTLTAEPKEIEPLPTYDSDPAAAALLAAGLLPPDRVGKIVLLTDGHETSGQLFTIAQGIGVPIDVVPLEPLAAPEVSVSWIKAPPHAQPLDMVDLEFGVLSNRPTTAEIIIERNGEELHRFETELGGKILCEHHYPTTRSDSTVFSVRVIAAEGEDTVTENNQRQAVVVADPRRRALCVAANAAAAQAIRQRLDEAGFDVDAVTTPGQVEWNGRSLAARDLVVLYDVPASSISEDAAVVLKKFVRNGGGLIAVGGKATFAEEVFAESPFEPILPVKAVQRREEGPPVLALVLVIDKSLSMEKENRMTLAKEAAKKTVGVLTERDKLGVIAFGDDATWISDLARLSNRVEVQRRIDGLEPLGATRMYLALEKAYLALEQVDADRRAMIVLTDGVPTPGDYDVLAQAMSDARIRVSTVTVSEGADQTIMQDIARLAGGQHFHCDDPNEVPRILEREARRATAPSSAVEFRPFTLRKLPGLDISTAPPLTGYAATSPKPQSEVLLTTGEGDPLLSWWRYGRGIAVAATSDGVAGRRWGEWDGFGRFWSELARHAVRRDALSNVDVSLRETEGGLSIEVDALTADGGFLNGATAEVTVTDENGNREEFPLAQVAPGKYRAVHPTTLPARQDLQISLTDDSGTQYETRRGWSIDYLPEYRQHPDGPNEPLLKAVAQVTGGSYAPKPEEIFADDGRRVERVVELWGYLLMAALVLFVFDVALRRMRFSPKETGE